MQSGAGSQLKEFFHDFDVHMHKATYFEYIEDGTCLPINHKHFLVFHLYVCFQIVLE